jgi:sulfonate transport system substrate-binding protein
VIAAYERARNWIIAHPDETVALLSEESKLSAPVARLQLKRNDFSHPQIGREHIEALRAASPILLEEDLVKSGTDLPRTINALIDPSYAQGVVKA